MYCADCRLGEGAVHFAKAKLRGATQLMQFLAGDYTRPVPQPTEIPSAICTRRHATERLSEDRLHIRRTYGHNEKAVWKITIYRMLVGSHRDGKWQGEE